MRISHLTLFLVVAAALWFALTRGGTNSPKTIKEVAAEYEQRDLDGRIEWVRATLREAGSSASETGEQLAAVLVEAGEAEVLEWIEMEEPSWGVFGRALELARDERWPRLAAHVLENGTDDARDRAEAALLASPGTARGWLEKHASAIGPRAVELLEGLELLAAEALETDALPPVSEEELLGSAGVVDLEAMDIEQASSRRVLRVLDSARAGPPWAAAAFDRAKAPALEGLLASEDPLVRGDGMERASRWSREGRLAPTDVPTARLWTLASSEGVSAEERDRAFDAFLRGHSYAVHVECEGIVLDSSHRHWGLALSHLARVGDRFTKRRLEEADPAEMSEEQRRAWEAALDEIEARIAGENEQSIRPRVQGILERMTYADLSIHALREVAIEELSLDLLRHFDSYDVRYEVKNVLVLYEATERLGIDIDPAIFVARIKEHALRLLKS